MGLSQGGRNRLVGSLIAKQISIHLITNLPADIETARLPDLVEVESMVYQALVVKPEAWARDPITGIAKLPTQRFTFGGPLPKAVTGYYVASDRGHTILWARKFPDGPYAINMEGDAIELDVEILTSSTVAGSTGVLNV